MCLFPLLPLRAAFMMAQTVNPDRNYNEGFVPLALGDLSSGTTSTEIWNPVSESWMGYRSMPDRFWTSSDCLVQLQGLVGDL